MSGRKERVQVSLGDVVYSVHHMVYSVLERVCMHRHKRIQGRHVYA
jgi:hypothetical protein